MSRIRSLLCAGTFAAALISHVTSFSAVSTFAAPVRLEKQLRIQTPASHSLARIGTQLSIPLHMSSGDDEMDIPDRILACAPYVLPMVDGVEFGKYIFMRIPALGLVEKLTLGGLVNIFDKVPFSQLIIFIALSFASRNPEIPRQIRFNMQQAILIDIALIFPSVLGGVANNLPRFIVEPSTNFVFFCFAAAVGYSVVSNLSGKVPDQIPLISRTADEQIGPF